MILFEKPYRTSDDTALSTTSPCLGLCIFFCHVVSQSHGRFILNPEPLYKMSHSFFVHSGCVPGRVHADSIDMMPTNMAKRRVIM